MNRDVLATVEDALGARVLSHRPISGGMINRVSRVETGQGVVAVKSADAATADWFRAEAAGLESLRAAKALRVPEVVAVGGDDCPFLALEWLEAVPVREGGAFTGRFAAGLARQHRTAIAPDGRYGLWRDNYVGALPQENLPADSWAAFYRERRLLPQVRMAREGRRLTAGQESLLLAVCDRLDVLLEDMDEPAALLHGDLWSGNFLCLDGDEPAVIDPSAYYGPREMEMAYVELFGGFPPGFMDAYQQAYLLSEGYERRRPVHQLYPLLVHVNHFGEPYGLELETHCRRLL